MSWILKLHETYERCVENQEKTGNDLWPISHFVKKAHVEIVLDGDGNIRPGRIKKLEWNESSTLIPSTEKSAGRTAGIAPHPLCEEVGYCATDLPAADSKKNDAYIKLLSDWCSSDYSHDKAKAVLRYILKRSLWSDLSAENVFPLTVSNASGQKTKVEDEKVFIRWRIESPSVVCSSTWEDQRLIEAWTGFDRQQNAQRGFCMVTGRRERLAQNHSRFLRYPGDGAKLVSANDFSGYTFKGRFTDSKDDYEKQVCSVSFDVSQKAHNALRWLIVRQGYRNGEGQVIVSWAVAGKPVPDPFSNTLDLLDIAPGAAPVALANAGTAQAFGLRLKNAIAGYGAKLEPTDDIVVMGLDSATPGRMAITFYREVKGAEFLARVEAWHTRCAWPQNFGKDYRFVGAPAPRDIAEAAYGRRLDDNLRKATVERLLPCIIDGLRVPRDLVESTTRRASNRVGFEQKWEWEKCLGIACALFSGYHNERSYQMALEQDRTSREYLYGRLLAIAERIEGYALYVAKEKERDTMAARLMQRFADRPYSTWKTIELSLTPYKSRLRTQRPGFLFGMDKLMDEVMGRFAGQDFMQDTQLSGEFLLGYHCQRQALRPNGTTTPTDDSAEQSSEE